MNTWHQFERRVVKGGTIGRAKHPALWQFLCDGLLTNRTNVIRNTCKRGREKQGHKFRQRKKKKSTDGNLSFHSFPIHSYSLNSIILESPWSVAALTTIMQQPDLDEHHWKTNSSGRIRARNNTRLYLFKLKRHLKMLLSRPALSKRFLCLRKARRDSHAHLQRHNVGAKPGRVSPCPSLPVPDGDWA